MNILRLSALGAMLLVPALCAIACGGPGDANKAPEDTGAVESTIPLLGEMAEVWSPDDSVPSGGGYVVVVRRKDGSTVPAVFRGPSKLAELASGGDYEFHEDSLPSRVRPLEPGQELRKPGGGGPRAE
jgi:hypothetical protein